MLFVSSYTREMMLDALWDWLFDSSDIFGPSTISIYPGSPPLDLEDVISETPLVSMTFMPSDMNFNSSEDRIELDAPLVAEATSSGTATWFAVFNNAPFLIVAGLVDEDMFIDDPEIELGADVTIVDWVIAFPPDIPGS